MSNWPISNSSGRIWVVSGPSGTGKSTLVRRLLASPIPLAFSVSHTTRDQRTGEKHGEDYFFVDRATFEGMIESDQFLEWADYNGNYYGTSEPYVNEQLAAGLDVLLDIEIVGAAQVRLRRPDARGIFILPPSLEELRRRLVGRGTESASSLERRLGKALIELEDAHEYDFLVLNSDVDTAYEDLVKIVQSDRYSTDRQRVFLETMLEDFRKNR